MRYLSVTDVRMPELSGVDLLRRLRELKLGIPVIVITGHGDVPLAVEAMKIGALDFLEKPPLMMKCCWHRYGRRSTSWTMTKDARGSATKSSVDWRPCRNASATCWKGLVSGHANKQIAYDLGISSRTIEMYRANLMTKMQAASLSNLVRMSLIARILNPKLRATEDLVVPPSRR